LPRESFRRAIGWKLCKPRGVAQSDRLGLVVAVMFQDGGQAAVLVVLWDHGQQGVAQDGEVWR